MLLCNISRSKTQIGIPIPDSTQIIPSNAERFVSFQEVYFGYIIAWYISPF